MQIDTISQLLINGVLNGFVFSLVSVGLTLIYGIMEVVNFAHGSLLMIGMYITYLFATYIRLDPIISFPLATALSAMLGVAIYRLVIRQVLGSAKFTQLLATFGLMVLFTNGAQFLFKSDYRLIKAPLVGGRISVLGAFIGIPQLIASLGCVIAAGLVYYLVNCTDTGHALLATAEDKEAAMLMGIDTERMHELAWAVGAGCAGFAGALLANYYYIFPQVGDIFGTIAVITVALGGFGSIEGALLAGIVIGLVMVLGGYFIGPAHKYTIIYLSYFVILLVRPRGLFGRGQG